MSKSLASREDFNDPEVTPEVARSFGLSEEEWKHLIERIGRSPSYAELGVVSAMWSEHCSYKSSRVHLKRLPTTGPKVVQGPGENAGAVDLGDGLCAVFKMESHNHPSFIEPYQGAATGVGGILRDVFTMGARPIASLNSLRFGSPDHPRTEHLLRGVVAGIGGYGNCIGVPTVGGELQFDPSYNGNILVNVFNVGIARSEELFFGRATGIGNPVIYVGARTGRDGIHGATMSSAGFESEAESKLPTVQVGDPFMEKLLLEACLEIFATDCLEGVQDMGAAGLTSSAVEMASRGGTGIELDLDRVPRRTYGLTPYEMLLSESQERMLMVAKRGREQEIFEICERWGLDAAVIGRVTDSGRFVCLATPGCDPLRGMSGSGSAKVAVDLPIELLADEAPCYDRPQRAPAPRCVEDERSLIPAVGDHGKELIELLASPQLGSRRWIWRQFDHIVGVGSVCRPGESDAALIRAFGARPHEGEEKYLAIAVDGNARPVYLDPYQGAAMVVAECARNIVCSGAEPLGVTDCLNFGNPQNPETMWEIAEAIDGIAAACKALELPIVSGNVSLYNETDGRSILPTPVIAMVGQLRDLDDRLPLGFQREGDLVGLLGHPGRGHLGASAWLSAKLGAIVGSAPHIDLQAEVALQKLVLELARDRSLSSAHDLSEGGLAVAIAEASLARGIGAKLQLAPLGQKLGATACLFAEDPSRVLISASPEQRAALEARCERAGVPLLWLGHTGGRSVFLDPWAEIEVERLRSAHENALVSLVGND